MTYQIHDSKTLELFELPEWDDPAQASERELAATLGIKAEDISELEQQFKMGSIPDVESLQHGLQMTKAKARVLAAAMELFRRQSPQDNKRISFPADAIKFLQFLNYKEQEHFVSVTLNGAHEVINVKVISIGLLNRTVVHPREVFRPAIADNAAAIICAHNHPSGSTTPSDDDRDVTARLCAAGNQIGIKVLDHLIVSKNGYYSFLEHGEL